MRGKKWWTQKAPVLLVTLFWLSTFYFGLWAWIKIASFFVSQQKGVELYYLSFLFGSSDHVSIVGLFAVSIWGIFGWLLSTRVKFYQSNHMRLITFFTMALTIWGGVAAFGMSEARKRMLPFFEDRLVYVFEGNNADTGGVLEQLVFGQVQGFYLMIVIIPVLLLFFVSFFLINKYVEFDEALNKSFLLFEWNGKWLQKLSKLEQKEYWPDLELGPSSTTNEKVIIYGRDRTLNTIVVGSIGTGKTAAQGLPMIDSDLDHMVKYIEDYPEMYEREDYQTEEVAGRYLSGLSIIDPSNDLCQKSLQLVKAHGIPDEAITYINPLDPNTPNINPMRGPVDKVAEVFTQVIAGLDDTKGGGSFYFQQAQRNHLKHYIYLLKLHDTEKEVTLDMLLDMYNNSQLVRTMHVALKTTLPLGIDAIEDRDERNYWKIVQGIDEWFELNLLPKMERSGAMMIPVFDEHSNQMYYDAKEEHVQGLRNILNDIGANPLIRRVLFGKSDFDFDRHMEVGGVLLVNTAKGEMVQLARVLGKIVLMNLQNASFRREPNVSTFHHILVDEAPDYLYNSFKEFPAQSRKYKVIITTLQQTIAQMADQFGEHYMTTLIGTMRNRLVFGDVPVYDAEYFSKMFGEKDIYEEGQTEMSVSPLQEDPVSRSGSSYSKVRGQSMTAGDIMFQDAFQCAVKIVKDNKPMSVVQVNANFVPKRHFSEAQVVANEEALEVWLRSRRNHGLVIPKEVEIAIASIEETEEKNKEFYNDTDFEKLEVQEEMITIGRHESLDPQMVERAVNVVMDTHPRDEVRYQSLIPPATPIERPIALSSNKTQEQEQVNTIVLSKESQFIPTPVKEEIVDIVLPKVSLSVREVVEPSAPTVPVQKREQEAEAPSNGKSMLGSLVLAYEKEEAPTVTSHGYTQSKVSEEGEELLKKFQQIGKDKE